MIHIKTFLIIDGHSLTHRGFHALSANLTAPDGTPTSAIVGFMNMLYRVQDELQPYCTVAAFDAKGKTFRHEIYSDYKSTRKPLADDLKIQIPILEELLSLCGIKVISREGVEADDTAASIAKIARLVGYEVVVLSSDKDLFQILGDGVRIMRPVKHGVTGAEIYTAESFMKEYGFHPASMPDYLAITGDTSDNVKGVSGVGEKGAMKILAKYPTIEAVYAELDSLPKSQREKFSQAGKESVIWTRDNLTILRDNIFDDDPNFLNDCLNCKIDFDGAERLALRLGLSRVLKRIGSNKTPLPREFYQHTKSVTPECEIITYDYKSELRDSPARFEHSPKVWDLKTAYYLLHPDEANRKLPAIIEIVRKSDNPSESLKTLAGNIEAEIESYDGLREVMTEIDIPILPVLNRMEDHGIRIDPEIFASVQNELTGRISEIEYRLSDITGTRINLNSSAQVSWLLFDKLKFTPSGMTKGKTSYSTEAGVLE
ncbi:MAG: hypothetical protein II964_04040, partial [Synergistaceae bacterium]|nr:hypothetical protein [Synergistaceae bacterium]